MMRLGPVPPAFLHRLARVVLAACAPVALAALAALTPAPARADGTADEADLHFRMGTKDFARGDYESALAHFLHSNRIVPNRNVLFNIATAFEQLKRYVDAHRYYVEALDGETDARARAAVRSGLARVTPFVAVLDVETTPPGATVYIDRKDLGSHGRAPRALALPAGRYRIIAELEGYEPHVVDGVDVAVGSEKKVALALTRIVGTVHVEVEGGRAATVRVDDERGPPACQAPCDLELSPGQHELYFSDAFAQAEARQVTVTARGRTSATAALRPIVGSVLVRADEPSALVTVDGKPSGFTPAVIQGVPIGHRKVRVSLRGFAPVELDADVQASKQTELPEVTLVPLREVIAVSRYKESIDDAPSSVTILSGDELRAFGYPTIADALRGVRGFAISNDRAYASAGVRGLGQPDDYGNRLLVLSDGQSLNDNIANSSAIGSNARVDLHDIDRIEAVRGPGSLLYGTGALSGVVNLVSRPRDEPSQVQGGFGVYDNAVVHGRLAFHYNYAPDRGVWASVSAAHSDGYDVSIPGLVLSSTGPVTTATAHGVDAFDTINTAGRAWWGPVTLQWFYNHRTQNVPVGAYGEQFDDPHTSLADTRMMAELRVEPHLSDKVELLLRAHANRSESLENFAPSQIASPPMPNLPSVEDYLGTWVGAEARLVVTPITWLRLTGGGEFQYDPQASMTGAYLNRDGSRTSYLNESQPYNFGAGYGLVEASPRPWFRAVLGARVDVYSTIGPIFVPRAALVFKPGGHGSVLKVMGGRAFRAPSIYEQFYSAGSFQTIADDGTQKLGAESIYSGEIEYSQRFLSDWVALAAGYVGYVEHLIDNVALPSGATQYQNSSSPALLAGGDLELRREFRRGWMLSASYSYERAQYVNTTMPDPRLLNAPEHMASFRGIVPVIRDVVNLALRTTLEAPRRINFDSSATTGTALIADAALSGTLRDYGLHYTVGVYNIANVHYQVPVSHTFLAPTMPQNGTTFLIDLTAAYP